jgi:hypothetical protein
MKKILLIMMVAIAACTPQKGKINLKPSHNPNLTIPFGLSTQTEMKKMSLAKGVKMCTSDHLISFDDACNFVSAMLNQNNLYEMDTTYGLGGFMDSTDFTSDWEDGEVIQFFPCMNEKNDEVFLSYKDVKGYNYDLSTQCLLTDNEVLSRSTNTFTYDKDKSHISPGDVADFISTMTTELSTTHEKLDGKAVHDMNDYFFSQYTVNGKVVNSFQCGAMNKCEVLELLHQADSLKVAYDCVGIRYFFGYDSTRDNKIRLVLIGVKSDGSNLVHYATGEEAMMLEKEWPPDAPTPMDSTSIHH